MSVMVSLIKRFWKTCESNDQKRLSKQQYPTNLVEVVDLEYINDGHIHHKLDLYYPEGTEEKLPVIIDIHGGGWFYGDKELNKNYCLHLAQRGYAVFNISYRLCPEVTIKEQMQDCMAALDFIAKEMKNYPCDEKRVYLTGDSAGGQLAAFVAAAVSSRKIRKAYDTVNPKIKIRAVSLVSPVPYLNSRGPMKLYMRYIVGRKNKKYSKFLNFNSVLDSVNNYPPTILFTSIMDVIACSSTIKAYIHLLKSLTRTRLDFKLNPRLQHVYQVLYPEDKTSVKAIDKMITFFEKHN